MDVATYSKFLLALILVIGLIFGLAWTLKRLGFAGAVQGALGRKRRLGTVEAAALDGRHRVILIRRDDVEHLVLVGPNTSQVIERNIPAAPVPEGEAPAPAPGIAAFSQFLSRDRQP